MKNTIQIDTTNTPEKFCSMVDKIIPQLVEILQKLGKLEQDYFVQDKRLSQKGRVINFKNGVREEITQHDELKTKFKLLYKQLLDPYCTADMLSQRRDCIHGTYYPSFFNCLNTGCTIFFTMKSANKAVVELIPPVDSISFDMSIPDIRYITENCTLKPPYFYSHFEKYRFTMRRLEDDIWKIDLVHNAMIHSTRWRRDYYF